MKQVLSSIPQRVKTPSGLKTFEYKFTEKQLQELQNNSMERNKFLRRIMNDMEKGNHITITTKKNL